jgi:hypothetical protein
MNTPSTPFVGVLHRPRAITVLIIGLVVAFFFGFALVLVILSIGYPASRVPCLLVALFFLAFGAFFFLLFRGLTMQRLSLSEDGISFLLAPLGKNLVLPGTLRNVSIPWSEVRAVDVKSRDLGGPQRIYIPRTSAGDFVFVWPQWPDADAIAAEIIRRSGAVTSKEDMEAPAGLRPLDSEPVPINLSRGERLMRGAGLIMLIVIAIFGALLLVVLFGVKEDERGRIFRAFLYLSIAGAGAQAMRKYRRIR